MTSSSRAPDTLVAVACALAVTLASPALAQDPPPPSAVAPAVEAEPRAVDSETPPDELVVYGEPAPDELVVYGDLQIARARQQVIRDLRDLGYRGGKRKDGYTVYRPESPWRPSVRVYDDGFVVIKRSPPRFMAPGDPNNKLNYLWCLPPFTPMCLRIGGVVVSKRKLEPQKARVANAVESELRDWRAAVSAKAMAERVGERLPDQLDNLWSVGVPFEPGQPLLVDPAARRAAILEMWSDRTCTPEGEQVREVLALFLTYEVQASPFPVTAAEMTAAEQANRCGGRLDLGLPTGPGGP